MKKTVNTPKKGVTYSMGNVDKGVMTILDKGIEKRVMLLFDYVATRKEKGEKISCFSFVSHCAKNGTMQLTSIKGRKKFNIWVCLDGSISPEIGNENGIFTAKVGNQWRDIQFIDQYQKQHSIGSKQAVLAKARQGISRLSHAALTRYASPQNVNFVVLP